MRYAKTKCVNKKLLINVLFDMGKYKCEVCGYVYNPEYGDYSAGIEPGTPFSDLPDDYICPVCSVGKEEFVAMTD